MLTNNDMKNLTAKLRDSCLENLNYTFSNCKFTLSDVMSIDLDRAYKQDTFNAKQIALIRQIQEFDVRYAPAKGSRELDSLCFNNLVLTQEICDMQNKFIDKLSYKDNPWLVDILLTAAGLVAEAVQKVEDAQRANNALPQFIMEDFGPFKDLRLPVAGFDIGPGVCANTEYADVISKFEVNGVFAVSAKSDFTLRYKQACLVNFVGNSFEGFKPLNLRIKSYDAVKISYVPKNSKISRDIVPQLNGDLFLQFPMCSFLTSVLDHFNIDLEKQPEINKELARNGSLYDNYDEFSQLSFVKRRNPRWCTVDSKSASHLIGTSLCDFIFPQWIFDYMSITRCDNIYDNLNGQRVPLKCMATMGNAFCFPMQTIVFAAIARACNIALGIPSDWVSVFGDDVIIDVACYDLFLKVLKSLHMIPNEKKSFAHGYFRESCGGDFFQGYQVRPVSPRKLYSLDDLYVIVNQIIDWHEEQNLFPSHSLCKIMAELIIKHHMHFNVARVCKLGKGARGNVPYFIVPRFCNSSSGVRLVSATIATALLNLTRLATDDTNQFTLDSFGIWSEDLQCEVVKYPFLNKEARYRNTGTKSAAVIHATKMSGKFVKAPKKVLGEDKRRNDFHIAGKADERSVQRVDVIPFNQWNVDPEGSVYHPSLCRLTCENMLLTALCFAARKS